MTDPRNTIDELRSVLQSADLTQWQPDQLELIKQYSTLCREATRRLSECESLLSKNLYSEAVQLAQSDPDLLDLVTLLDIPERDVLEQVCLSQKLPTPPALSMATAQAIEQAFLKVQPLDDLLKQHRLLALARAPLPVRRKVLQQIAERDPTNPIWKQDLLIWETELLKQLQQKLKLNIFLNDANQVLEYAEAVHDGTWTAKPSQQLLKDLQKASQAAEQSKARQAFMQLKEKVQAAYYARDVKKVMQYRNEWKQTAEAAGLSFNASVTQHVAEAFRWLSDIEQEEALQRRQDQALLKLEEALDSTASVESVKDTWKEYLDTGAKPSNTLRERYERHLNRRLELRQDRKKLTWIVIGTGIAALLVIATIVTLQIRQSTLLKQAHASLKYYLSEDQLGDFEEYYNRLVKSHPDLTQDNSIQELHRDYRNRKDSIQRRANDINTLLAEIKNAPVREKEPEAVRKATGYLERAKDNERTQIAEAISSHEKAHTAWITREKQDILSELDSASKLTADNSQKDMQINSSTIDLKRKLRNEMEERVTKLNLPDSERLEFQTRLEQFDQSLMNLEKLAKDKEGYDFLNATLLASIQKPGKPMNAFSEGIHSFIQRFPDHSLRTQLEKIQPTIAYSVIAADSGAIILACKGNPFTVAPGSSSELIQQLKRIVNHRPKLPEHQQLATVLDILQRRAMCVPSQPLLKDITTFFKQPGMKDTAMVLFNTGASKVDKQIHVKSSEFENCQTALKMGNENKLVTYIATLEGKTATKEYSVKGFNKLLAQSPQAELAGIWERAMQLNEAGWTTDAAWRTTFTNYLDEIINKPHVDPALRLDLFRTIIERGSKGSLIFEQGTKPWADHLKTKQVRNRTAAQFNWSIEWIDPESPDGEKLRSDCQEVLTSMPAFSKKKLIEEMNLAEAALCKQLLASPQLAGWVQFKSPTEWNCEGQFARFPDASSLMVLVENAGQDQLVWKKIGSIQNRQAKLEKDVKSLNEGTPCFVIIPYYQLPKE